MHPIHEAKASAFMLAASKFLKARDQLRQLVYGNPNDHLVLEEIQVAFDQCVQDFFRWWPSNGSVSVSEASADIVSKSDALCRKASAMDRRAKAILEHWKEEVLKGSESTTWKTCLDECHQLGRIAAQAFFRDHALLNDRLKITAPVTFEAKEKIAERPVEYQPKTNVIDVKLSLVHQEPAFSIPEPPSQWYCALPFRFMHEYTSHIFPFDAQYEMFNDGWMLHATSHFIQRSNIFSKQQAEIFEKRLKTSFKGLCKRGVELAEQVRLVMEIEHPGMAGKRFQEFTFNLSTLQPTQEDTKRLDQHERICLNLERAITVEVQDSFVLKALVLGSPNLIDLLDVPLPDSGFPF